MVEFSKLVKEEAVKRKQPKTSPAEEITQVKFSKLVNEEAVKRKQPKTSPAEEITQEEVPSPIAPWYQRACQFLEDTLVRVRDEEKPDEFIFLVKDEGERIIDEIVDAHSPGHLPQELLIKALHTEVDSSFLVTNPVNVTVYSILMGGNLGLPREGLLELGLAALLHDIGKIMVPESILHKERPLTHLEWTELREYPEQSFNILSVLGDNYSYLAETAFQVYETLDGSGYPRGLEGEEIHPYAQIIGLLDIFEAISHDRPYRRKFSPFAAIKEIIRAKKHAFHKDLLKTMLRTFSLFPLNSFVKLNSGAVGKVVQTDGDQVLRPKVEIVLDAQEKGVPFPRTIDLKGQALLHVVDVVSEESLRG
jgi:HD-GYP domain-containing protein (c-di-GMP phosphodiesterase class II)